MATNFSKKTDRGGYPGRKLGTQIATWRAPPGRSDYRVDAGTMALNAVLVSSYDAAFDQLPALGGRRDSLVPALKQGLLA